MSDRAAPDEYEKTLPEIFPDDAPRSFTCCPEMGGTGRWVWTTFMDYQWDLNYTNPAVFRGVMRVLAPGLIFKIEAKGGSSRLAFPATR
ncbi:MAG: hypothetical protein ACN4G0_09610 [Polyangiales bacterium]